MFSILYWKVWAPFLFPESILKRGLAHVQVHKWPLRWIASTGIEDNILVCFWEELIVELEIIPRRLHFGSNEALFLLVYNYLAQLSLSQQVQLLTGPDFIRYRWLILLIVRNIRWVQADGRKSLYSALHGYGCPTPFPSLILRITVAVRIFWWGTVFRLTLISLITPKWTNVLLLHLYWLPLLLNRITDQIPTSVAHIHLIGVVEHLRIILVALIKVFDSRRYRELSWARSRKPVEIILYFCFVHKMIL